MSYNALKGCSSFGTLKFTGVINGLIVQVLVDNGSSDNFLQPRLDHFLKLPIEPIPKFQVLVGNGSALVVEERVSELEVKIQGHVLKLPMYLFDVTGVDLVLGATWLATIRPHISYYSKLTLKFYLGNQFVTLQGDQPFLPMLAHFHHLRRMHHTHAI